MRITITEESYLAERLVADNREHLYRIANEPGMVETLLGWAWLLLRAGLRSLGHLMLMAGQFLLRMTRQARREATRREVEAAAAYRRLQMTSAPFND